MTTKPSRMQLDDSWNIEICNGNCSASSSGKSKELINVLENTVMQLTQQNVWFESGKSEHATGKIDIFEFLCCPNCHSLLENPCTIYCGCTFCEKCVQDILEKEGDTKCPRCAGARERICWVQRTNNVLKHAFNTWFHEELESMKLKFRGDFDLKNSDFTSAIANYDKALEICPCNYLAWIGRSKTLFFLGKYAEALENIENSLLITTEYDQIYMIKAEILVILDRLTDATITLLQGLAVNPSNEECRALLNEIFSQLTNSYSATDVHDHNRKDEKLEYKCGLTEDGNKQLTDAVASNGNSSIKHNGIDDFQDALLLPHLMKVFEENTNQLNSKIAERSSQLKFERKTLTNEQMEQLSADLECSLCKRTLFEPSTITCGHVFCKECIRRWLDHNYCCPICRFTLFHHINVWKIPVTTVVDSLVKMFYPDAVKERQQAKEEENANFAEIANDTNDDIPIFVCCIALPSQKLQLQVFEPRYRLMLRQCLESGSKQFGMCVYNIDRGFADYGVMLEVDDAFFVPDGRAYIVCTGGRRFKVLSRGMRDGYNTAKVQWLKDTTVGTQNLDSIKELNLQVHSDVKSFLQKVALDDEDWLTNNLRMPVCNSNQINTRNGPDWIWWLVDSLLDSTEQKLRFIATDSLEERLTLIRGHLEIARLLTL